MKLFERFFKDHAVRDVFSDYVPGTGDEEHLIIPEAELHLDEAADRRDYVESCLQRMYEGAQEVERLKEEYADVTDDLNDMDTIRMLSPDRRDVLAQSAQRVLECESRIDDAERRKNKMNEQTYLRMERFEGEFLDVIRKFDDTEDYHKKIKSLHLK